MPLSIFSKRVIIRKYEVLKLDKRKKLVLKYALSISCQDAQVARVLVYSPGKPQKRNNKKREKKNYKKNPWVMCGCFETAV